VITTLKTETVPKKDVLSDEKLNELKIKIDKDFIECDNDEDIFDDLEF
jgi:hypothetical protein